MSVSVSVPLPLPASMGEKVILIAQLAPTATEPPQLLVSAKGPDRVILRGLSAALPVLVSVITCGALLVETVCAGKFRLVGARPTPGHTPVPVRLAVSVSGFVPVYATVSVPVRVPAAVGVNQTVMGHGVSMVKPSRLSQGLGIFVPKSPLIPTSGVSSP